MANKPLLLLRRDLLAYTDDLVPTGRVLCEQARDALFDADRVNGRWYYRHDAVPAIAAALGLTPKAMQAAQAKRPRRPAQPEQAAA